MNVNELNAAFEKTAADVLNRCALVIGPGGRLKRAYRLHVPSGDMKYPSFWVRDAAMMAESGLIDTGELWDWIEFVCLYGHSGGEERRLRNGLSVPPWSVPDHINFDGGPVFYPGTYGSGDDQGNGRFGFFPPHDDAYYFIHMIHQFYRQAAKGGALHILNEPIGGYSPLDRARKAFGACRIDEATGLCESRWPFYTVDWGFCDSIVKTGLLLFPSLLRLRAAGQLADLAGVWSPSDRRRYEEAAARLRRSIVVAFATPGGWLLSATERCRQPDVWGTAFAVWTGALRGAPLDSALEALRASYRAGIVSSDGYIRHVPIGYDASADTVWQGSADKNAYQNGGYWATPAGWYAYALSLADRSLAAELLSELMNHTSAHRENGAPYEWKARDEDRYSGRWYGTSAALPYAGSRRIALRTEH